LHKPFAQSHDILYTLSHLLAKHLNTLIAHQIYRHPTDINMSDNEIPKGKAPQTGASGAAWSDKERVSLPMNTSEYLNSY
jgi:hypothetical protein